MASQDHTVLISGLETTSLRTVGTFFSRFGTIKCVEKFEDNSVFVLYTDKESARNAISYSGNVCDDDVVTISHPSQDQFTTFQNIMSVSLSQPPSSKAQSSSDTTDEKSYLTKESLASSELTSLKEHLRSSLTTVPTEDILNMFQSFLSEIKGLPVPEHVPHPSYLHESDAMNEQLRLPPPAKPMSTFVSPPVVTDAAKLQPPVTGTQQAVVNPPLITPPPGLTAFVQYPKIIFFSGDDKDAPYQQWRNEVKCLIREGHTNANILQGIRRSVKGTAAEVLLNLGEDVTPISILHKFDIIFGVAHSTEALLEEYYTAHQKENEKVVVWGCRLESLQNKILKRGYSSTNLTHMLRQRFWSGLRDEHIKAALRHKLDANFTFDQLLSSAREVELEVVPGQAAKPQAPARIQTQVAASSESKLDNLIRQMEEMKSQIKNLQMKKTPSTVDSATSQTKPSKQEIWDSRLCFYCHGSDHFIADCAKLKKKNAGTAATSTAPTTLPSGNGM